MNNPLTVAISKAVKSVVAREASSKLKPGNYPIASVVWVKGSITKGEDYEQQLVAKADPWLLLAVALSHLNKVTVDSIVKEALGCDPELAKEVKRKAMTAIKKVKKPTLTECNGKVTTDLVIEELVEVVADIKTLREALKVA